MGHLDVGPGNYGVVLRLIRQRRWGEHLGMDPGIYDIVFYA